MRRVVWLLVIVSASAPLSSSGQDAVADARAALRAAPDDPRARCRLADALVRAGQHDEARTVATPAIEVLEARTDRRSRRVLGACLYNRGRAHEEGGRTRDAVRDYAASLAARSNDVVRGRMTRLAPAAPSDDPLAALALVESDIDLEYARVDASPARTRDGTRWRLVTVSPSGNANGSAYAYAIAHLCGRPRVAEIDSVAYDNATYLGVDQVTSRRLGDVDALVVTTSGGGDDNCGSASQGMTDYRHAAVAAVFADGCAIRVARFPTDSHDCGGDYGLTVRFGADGQVRTSRPRWDSRADRVGIFALRDIAR